MAAGHGRRLNSGSQRKTMFPVAGVPLVEHVLRQFEAAEIDHVAVAAATHDEELRRYLHSRRQQRRFRSLTVHFVAPNSGTGTAVRLLVQMFAGCPILLSTVDLVAPSQLALELCQFAEASDPSIACVLAVTPQVQGNLPTFVDVSPDTGIVKGFGKEVRPCGALYGNLRWYRASSHSILRQLPAWATAGRDSEILQALIRARPGSVKAMFAEDIFDIDTLGDVVEAEAWLATRATQPA